MAIFKRKPKNLNQTPILPAPLPGEEATSPELSINLTNPVVAASLPASDEGYVRSIKIAALREGQIIEAQAGKTKIAVVKVQGNYFVFAAYCPHQAWPLWAGSMEGELVRCFLHRWQFNVRTGENTAPGDMPVCLPVYPVKVQGEYLMVQLPNKPVSQPEIG